MTTISDTTASAGITVAPGVFANKDGVQIARGAMTVEQLLAMADAINANRQALLDLNQPSLPDRLRNLADFLEQANPTAGLYITIGSDHGRPDIQVTQHGTPNPDDRLLAAVDLIEDAKASGYDAHIYAAYVVADKQEAA